MKRMRASRTAQRLGCSLGTLLLCGRAISQAEVTDDSEFVVQVVPAAEMQTEEVNHASITMRNTGTGAWSLADGYCLAAQNRTTDWNWGVASNLVPGRVCLSEGETVAPNQTKTFTFVVSAPPAAGVYNFQWQMVKSGTPFGSTTTETAISVFTPSLAVESITQLRPDGGRVDWSQSGNGLIAYDQVGRDEYDYASPRGCYDVWTMSADGSNDTCLTCGRQGFANRHLGNPAWDPTGRYIVFQAEKARLGGCSSFNTPGLGSASELWVMTADGQGYYQLTQVGAAIGAGVLHPHFSNDGRKLSWSEKYKAADLQSGGAMGYWKLKVADFSDGPSGPQITNTIEYTPGLDGFYENHGFSPDSKTLLFSTNVIVELAVYAADALLNVYALDLSDGSATGLTRDEGGHNEHASYSPNGTKVLYMTGLGNVWGTDFWLMNPNGTAKQRLTNFNRSGFAEYRGLTNDVLTAADSSWSPDGLRFVGYVQHDVASQDGGIYLVKLKRTDDLPIAPPERIVVRQRSR